MKKSIKNLTKRWLPLFLALAMCLSLLNLTAFAAEDGSMTGDENASQEDITEGADTDTEDGEGTDTEDGNNTDTEDGDSTDTEDGDNTGTEDGDNTPAGGPIVVSNDTPIGGPIIVSTMDELVAAIENAGSTPTTIVMNNTTSRIWDRTITIWAEQDITLVGGSVTLQRMGAINPTR